MLKLNRNRRLLLSFSSGILLSLPWLGLPGWIIFIAFLPLFFIENFFVEKKNEFAGVSFFGHAFITSFVWNGLTTWWIFHATVVGAIMAVSVNSFLMALVLWLAHFARRNLKGNLGYITLIVFWISFEYIHFNWDIEWPWLTLGHSFANNVKVVQWYEYTGVLGGSFWALAVNVMLLKFVLSVKEKSQLLKRMLFRGTVVILVLVIPIVISILRYSFYIEKENSENIVIVQPNINPYNEDYTIEAENEKLEKFIRLAKLKTDNETDLVIGPETLVENYFNWNLDSLANNKQFLNLVDFQRQYFNAEMLFGVSSSKYYSDEKYAPKTARNSKGELYDVFNSAVFIDRNEKPQTYHKSILVSGVEKVPYLKYFGFLQNVIFDLGGASGNLGRQDEPGIFISADGTKLAPVICYESVFGEYITNYIKKGAQIVVIITNDGWWKNTPGYKQHFSFARLRAVETRRSIARAANTGISGFINQRGDIELQSEWWKETVIKGEINKNSAITFYVKFGDYIGRISLFVSVLFTLLLISSQLKKGKKNPH